MTRRRGYRAGYRRDGRIDLRRLPRLIERPLGRHRAYGMAMQGLHENAGGDPPDALPDWTGEPTIWLDPRDRHTRVGLETAIHEALHLACPFMYEDVVGPTGRYIAMILWRLGYRRAVD